MKEVLISMASQPVEGVLGRTLKQSHFDVASALEFLGGRGAGRQLWHLTYDAKTKKVRKHLPTGYRDCTLA